MTLHQLSFGSVAFVSFDMSLPRHDTSSFDFPATCDVEGKYAADSHNVCWYHQCVVKDGNLDWIPRRCAWGTIMSSKFEQGATNPCTVNLNQAGKIF